MQIAALVAEYNPLHAGHIWQLQAIRQRLGANTLILVVQSGCWTQRGEPALLNKYDRAASAVRAGADLVLELPFSFSCSSAGYFAEGAIRLLLGTGLHLTLCFSTEARDFQPLHAAASALLNPANWEEELAKNLRKGKSYPLARARALATYLSEQNLPAPILLRDEVTDVPDALSDFPVDLHSAGEANPAATRLAWERALAQPNLQLGIEYLRARLAWGGSKQLRLLTLPRITADQAGSKPCFLPSADESWGKIWAATPLRTIARSCSTPSEIVDQLSGLAPDATVGMLAHSLQQTGALPSPAPLYTIAYSQLLGNSTEHLASRTGLPVDQLNRLRTLLTRQTASVSCWEDLLTQAAHKSFPRSSLARGLSYLCVGGTQEERETIAAQGPAYLRPLAYSKRGGRTLLRLLRKESQLPLVNTVSDFWTFPAGSPIRQQGLMEWRAGCLAQGGSLSVQSDEYKRYPIKQ